MKDWIPDLKEKSVYTVFVCEDRSREHLLTLGKTSKKSTLSGDMC